VNSGCAATVDFLGAPDALPEPARLAFSTVGDVLVARRTRE